MNAQNLIAKVWDYANILRDSGVSYTDYVAQLSYLLFLKMESEIASVNPNATSLIPLEFRWEILKKLDGLELESAYSRALNELSKQSGIVGTIYQKAQNKINEPAKLKRLISLVDGETWLGLSVDVKGAIYEGLLAKNATETKAGAGQYFTPRVLCESIVRLMRPKPEMSVCDPACGTGGFLLAAYAYMKAQSKDSEVLRTLREDKLYGKDITPLVVSLCAMNLFLHGLGVGFDSNKAQRPLVIEGDSLLELGNVRFDMILTNPPFGKKSSTKIMGEDGSIKRESETYTREDFIATTSNKQLNFLQHIMSLLKIGGKAAVVLPDNVLFEGGAGEKVRKRLLSEFNLHTILRLPTGIFYAQGVKANVLFFDKYEPLSKGMRTDKVWVYDLRSNVNLSLVSNPLSAEHLSDFEKCFCADNFTKRVESERFRAFSAESILARDKANLDIFWLKDESLGDLEDLPAPREIATMIKSDLQSAMREFDSIGV
ncbi:type I restriction-modification system subunit M [Helicobacter sp. 23-1046]